MKEIQQLLNLTTSRKEQYSGKLDLSVDSCLVDDIGEAPVSKKFDIELYGKNEHKYDGYHKPTNKKVQIKSSLVYNF